MAISPVQAVSRYRAANPAAALESALDPWLNYGSKDSSVLFRHPLTSTPSYPGFTVTAKGAGTPEHHALKGMRGAVAGGSSAAGYEITYGSPGAAVWPGLTTAGQMSFEVSTAYLAQASGSLAGSAGDALAASACVLSWVTYANANNGIIGILYRGSGASGQVGFRRLFSAIEVGTWFLRFTARSAAAGRWHSYGKPASGFTRVNVGWLTDGGTRRVFVAIDGLTLSCFTRDDTADPFSVLFLGGRPNYFNGYTAMQEPFSETDRWIRNLQVSSLAPTFPTVLAGTCKDISILSDSIINANTSENTSYGDLNYDCQILKAFEQKGVRPATLTRSSNSGYTLANWGGSWFGSVRAAIKAANPTCIVLNGGSNDVNAAGSTDTGFRDAIRDHIEYFCGLNGNPAPGVVPSAIVLTNIPDRGKNWNDYSGCNATNGSAAVTVNTNTGLWQNGDGVYGTGVPAGTTVLSGAGTSSITLSQNYTGSTGAVNLFNTSRNVTDSPSRVKAQQFRDVIAGIPAWFAATYPGASTKVSVCDVFNGMGGLSEYTGKINPADEVHPDYAGVYKIGRTLGQHLVALP